MQVLLHEGTSSIFGGAESNCLVRAELFFLMESSDRLHTIISWEGYELYVALTLDVGTGGDDRSLCVIGNRSRSDWCEARVVLFLRVHSDVSLFPYCTQWRIAVPLLHTVTYRCSLAAHSDVSLFPCCTQWRITFGISTLADDDTTLPWNVGFLLPRDAVSNPRRTEFWATPLRKPQYKTLLDVILN
jgi:hypothetical protein